MNLQITQKKVNKVIIYVGSDHAGFDLKEKVKRWLLNRNVVVRDVGNLKKVMSDDYPDYAAKVGFKVARSAGARGVGDIKMGILLCGSAEGMCIAANKIRGVRAVNPHTLIATMRAREHEDANILCLAGGDSMSPQPRVSFSKACKMIEVFLSTPFSSQSRHVRRLAKVEKLERSLLW